MDCLRVSGGKDHKGGASVKDSGASLEAEIVTVNGRGDRALPEAVLVDVWEGGEGVRVEFGLVKAPECNFTIVVTVGNSAKLVRCDGLANQPVLRKRFDGSQDTLFGKGGLG